MDLPLTESIGQRGALLLDWGDTLMRVFPAYRGPMASWPRVELMPHAREALEKVRLAGWITVLATNAADSKESDIRAALGRGGIPHLIDRIYCIENVGLRKPSPLFFLHIAADLAIPPELMVMVGDDLENDIKGATRAGLRGAWVNPAAEPPKVVGDVAVISSLVHLPHLLHEWGAVDSIKTRGEA